MKKGGKAVERCMAVTTVSCEMLPYVENIGNISALRSYHFIYWFSNVECSLTNCNKSIFLSRCVFMVQNFVPHSKYLI